MNELNSLEWVDKDGDRLTIERACDEEYAGKYATFVYSMKGTWLTADEATAAGEHLIQLADDWRAEHPAPLPRFYEDTAVGGIRDRERKNVFEEDYWLPGDSEVLRLLNELNERAK